MSSYATKPTEGIPVIDANDDRLGVVDHVENDQVFVDPNDDVSSLATVVLGWEDTDDTHPLFDRHVDEVTQDAVYLKSNL